MNIIIIKKTIHNKQFNELHNQKNSITNNECFIFLKKDFPTKHYIINVVRDNNGYIENNVYNKYDNIIFNNTNNTTKHINNHINDVTNNNNKINKITM